MSDINQSQWNEVDSSNISADVMPGFPEGMNPSLVNDAARAVMGALRRWYNRTNPTVTSGGSANAQTLSYDVAPNGLVAGDIFRFIAGFTNTGACTLTINDLSAVDLVVYGTSLLGGELVAGQVAVVAYDGTYLQVLNPQSVYRAQAFFMDTGSANAVVVSAGSQWVSALQEGLTITVWIAATNTGATSIAFGSSTSDILRPSGAALQAGDIQADQASRLVYDGTNWRLFLSFSQQFEAMNAQLVGMPSGSPVAISIGTGLALTGNVLSCTVS